MAVSIHGLAGSLLLMVSCSILAGRAAAAAAPSTAAGRKLKQVTVFFETPDVAGSATTDISANAGVHPDGTVHAAGGVTTTTAAAVSNPILNALTGGAYNNKPKAGTIAYTQIPLLLEQTMFPTLSYGQAKAQGDLLPSTGGGWANAEFGYNPISNNLGASISTGSSNSNNLGGGESVGTLDPAAGKSGIEFAGWSNDQTNLADSRAAQSAQAIAYPSNVGNPVNPLTCTQALLYGVTLTNSDLGAPYGPLPRQNPPSVVPFCLGLFNFGTLDDFAKFVQERSVKNNTEDFFDDNRDGIIPGLAEYYPGGQVFNTTGRSTTAGNTTTTSTITAAPVRNTTSNRAANQPGSRGSGPVSLEPGSKDAKNAAKLEKVLQPPSLSTAVQKYVQNAPPAVQVFAATPIGKDLIGRIPDSQLSKLTSRATAFIQNVTDTAVQNWQGPMDDLSAAANNITSAVIYGTGDAVLKGAAKAIDAAQPIVTVLAGVQNSLQSVAKQSRDAATQLAARTAQELQQNIEKLPDGLKPQAQQAAAQLVQGGQVAAKSSGAEFSE